MYLIDRNPVNRLYIHFNGFAAFQVASQQAYYENVLFVDCDSENRSSRALGRETLFSWIFTFRTAVVSKLIVAIRTGSNR